MIPPPPVSLLVDTNIVVAFLTGDQAVIDEMEEAEAIVLSATVLGELVFGAYNSNQAAENVRRVENFLTDVAVLSCDRITSAYWGRIKAQLERLGRRIPDNDIWIAATALQYGLTLLTRDRHFENVEGLRRVGW